MTKLEELERKREDLRAEAEEIKSRIIALPESEDILIEELWHQELEIANQLEAVEDAIVRENCINKKKIERFNYGQVH